MKNSIYDILLSSGIIASYGLEMIHGSPVEFLLPRYQKAYSEFLLKNPHFSIQGTDKLVSCKKHDIYGTVSIFAEWGEDRIMLMLQTGSEVMPDYWSIYLAGCQLCMGPTGRTYYRKGLHLPDNGTYQVHNYESPEDQATFMAALKVYQWKESNHGQI